MSIANRRWQPLEEGDLIDIVAPGFAPNEADLEGALRFLESWGLRARVPKRFLAKDVVCSNTDQARLAHLKAALLAKDSKAIWCMRGGYGSIRLIPDLAKFKAPQSAKLFIGLSDITTLHVFLNQQWGWPTIHGPMLDRFGRGAVKPVYEKELKKVLFGHERQIEFKGLKALNEKAAMGKGSVRGVVSGGNLITLQSSVGTRGHWDTRGRILFFEDIGERGYRVDRVLEHFRQLGFFDRARAVIFGQFTAGHEPGGKDIVPQVMKRFSAQVKIPVYSGLQSGHDVIQRPVPFEAPSVLDLGPRGTLRCESGMWKGRKS